MICETKRYDTVVIGSGPAGQKAAIQAAKAGCRVMVVELQPEVGGACVQHGTIPSKTLRETALNLVAFRRRSAGAFQVELQDETKMQSLMRRLDQVVRAHHRIALEQLTRNHVDVIHGRASFVAAHSVEVVQPGGRCCRLTADYFVIASGSRPREPESIVIDHSQVFDSDSLLSLNYLPRSLTVLGSGVIASEYASTFAALGVDVTMADGAARPLSFIDPELSERFTASFQAAGGTFRAGVRVASVTPDGLGLVETRFADGSLVISEKVLVALGRVASVRGLNLEKIGIRITPRGHVEVDQNLCTAQPHIYAVGDVIGPPALAASAMEQGRRAMCHALSLPLPGAPELLPVGIYTIPEISCVGLSEADAIASYGSAIVGRALFSEVARGMIAGIEDGFLKLVCAPDGRKLLGIHVVGEGAAELIAAGQLALLHGDDVDLFIENIFNFPTLTEAYRVAALDVVKQRARLPVAVG